MSGDRGLTVFIAPDSWSKGRRFESWQKRREKFLLEGHLSVLGLISVSVPLPWSCSKAEDPGHSAKNAGGRLQLNTHAPNVCGFAWSAVTWCTVVWRTQNAPRRQQFHVAASQQPNSAVSTLLRMIFKTRYKRLQSSSHNHIATKAQ